MVLVVEGSGDKRRIVSIGQLEAAYNLAPGQEFRHVTIEPWPGYRKADIHWDETLQAIVPTPYPLSAEELADKLEVEAEARMLADRRMLKAFEIIIREIEYLRPEAKPRQPEFQSLIDKLREYRGV